MSEDLDKDVTIRTLLDISNRSIEISGKLKGQVEALQGLVQNLQKSNDKIEGGTDELLRILREVSMLLQASPFAEIKDLITRLSSDLEKGKLESTSVKQVIINEIASTRKANDDHVASIKADLKDIKKKGVREWIVIVTGVLTMLGGLAMFAYKLFGEATK